MLDTSKHAEIEQEHRQHLSDISDEPRSDERIKSDVQYIDMVRNQGITVETLCMMLTDAMFAAKGLRTGVKQPD